MKNHSFSLLRVALTALCLFSLFPYAGRAETVSPVTVEKTFLAKQPEESLVYMASTTLSPDSAHLAYVAKAETGMRVMVNNKEGKLYDQVAKGFPVFSPEKNRVGYIASKAGKSFVIVDETEYPGFDGACCLLFSPNGEKFAYLAQKEEKQIIFLNGTPQEPFDAIDRQIGLVFSPDSRHLAYSGLRENRVVLVIDGKSQPQSYDMIEEIAFSPDGKHIAYIAATQKKYFVVQDDIIQGPFDMAESLVWSPDSKTLVFVAIKNDDWITVKNGKAIPSGKYTVRTVFNPQKKEYEYMVPFITPPVFSPDSSRLAFTRADGFRYRILVANQEGPPFDSVGQTSFSPDSRHYAYVGIISRDGISKSSLVYDGNIIATYDIIVPPIIFSPDSQRIGFRAGSQEKGFQVVIDGKAGRLFDNVSSPFFSPDSQQVAYKALKNDKTIIIANDTEGEPYNDTTRPFFSPDSKHIVYLAMKEPLLSFLVVDGEKTATFSSYLPDTEDTGYTPIVFDSQKRFHFLASLLGENSRFQAYYFEAEIHHPAADKQ